MDNKSKIKELRKIVPIPISDALKLLNENEGDVEKCVHLFNEKSIKQICETTACDTKMATLFYTQEKFDVNRAISFVKEHQYDLHYTAIKGINSNNLNLVLNWIYIIESKDFISSLDYIEIESVIKTLLLIPQLKESGETLLKAKRIKDSYFIGYSDNDPISEFVSRHSMLDADAPFQKLCHYFKLKPIVLKEEILRHKRNTK